jgi:uncharacterized membrane protein YesL
MRFFKIVARAAVSFYEELFFFFLMGLIYVVCFFLVIPGPFALAGIYRISQRAVRGKAVKWRIVWQGVKEFGLRSLLVFLLVVVGYILLLSNLWFYNSPEISPFPASVGRWITPLWILLILLWSGVAFYATAFLVELKEPKTLSIFRNSLFLTILHPVQTLLFLVVSILVLVISVLLPVLLTVSPAFIATLSVTAVRTLVTDLKEKVEEEAEEGEEKSIETQSSMT